MVRLLQRMLTGLLGLVSCKQFTINKKRPVTNSCKKRLQERINQNWMI